MTAIRLCDDFGSDGFSWIVDDRETRTSHALPADGRVWLVDPVDWPEALERARGLGEPAAVLQLLDRHNRDSAAIAERLGIPHHAVPDELPDTPFECIHVVRRWRWKETALWWRDRRTLVVAETLGTNRFFTGGREPVGVHLVLRPTPPRRLSGFDAERLLVGHGEALSGPDVAAAVERALDRSRRDLPRVLLGLFS